MKETLQRALLVVVAGGAIVATAGAAFDLWPGENAIALLALLAAVAVVITLASKHQHMSTLSVMAMLAGLAGVALVAMANAAWLTVVGGGLCCAALIAFRFDSKGRNNHAA